MGSLIEPPSLNIPESQNVVKVSIIDTTSHMFGHLSKGFVFAQVPGFSVMDCGSFAFLIEHPASGNKYDKLVFDLGVRKDWENSPPAFVEGIRQDGVSITVEKDTADILREHGVDLSGVGGIVWSHWHFDHTGNPQTFPDTTDIIVGPGFKSELVPTSYPTVPDSHIDSRAWQGRNLREIDFEKESGGLTIGRFKAFDFYGDGSFYLLDAPGHTVAHISALARTTADPPTFIFMGGDIAHHTCEFRPTQYMPLPDVISPNPMRSGHLRSAITCPGEVFIAMHHKKSRTEPFCYPTPAEDGWHHDSAEATRSISKMIEFDAYDNIFSVIAHDNSLLGIVDLYPKSANDWLERGWKEKSRWAFLGHLDPYSG